MLFGKRFKEELTGRIVTSNDMKPTECTEFSRKNILIDYIISHAINDQRPYLEVSVLGYPVTGLLDTGANRTIVGGSGYNLFLRLGLKLVVKL